MSIGTSTTTSAVTSTKSPWRNRVLTAMDGYRIVLWSDGTSMHVSTSATGATWADQGVFPTGETTLPPLIDAVFAANALYILVGGTSGSTIYCCAYQGAGVFAHTTGPLALTLTSMVLSSVAYIKPILGVRLLWDPNGTVVDPNHVGTGTGLLHATIDLGATWVLHPIDPMSNYTSAGIKSLGQFSYSNGLVGASGATNGVVRKANTLFLLGPGGGTWAGAELAYSRTQKGSPTSTGSQSYATSGGPYHWDENGTLPVAGHYYSVSGTVAPLADMGTSVTPGTGDGSIVYTSPGVTNFSAGNWTFTYTTSTVLINWIYQLRFAMWVLPAGTTPTAAHLAALTPIFVNNSPTYTSMDTSTSGVTAALLVGLSSLVLNAGDQLYVETYVYSQSTPSSHYFFRGNNCGITILDAAIKSTPGSQSSYVVTYAGAVENPALAVSSHGAGLCLGDTSTDPPVDIAINTGTALYQARRTKGQYSVSTLTTGLSLVDGGAEIAIDVVSGEEDILFPAFYPSSGNQRIYVSKRIPGSTPVGWLTPQLVDSGTNIITPFIAVDPGTLNHAGPAVVWLSGTGPYTLNYDDQGHSASTAPSPPVGVTLVDSLSCEVYGDTSPFNVVSDFIKYQWQEAYPSLTFTYRNVTRNNRLGGFDVKVAEGSTYDLGRVSVNNGPVDASSYTWNPDPSLQFPSTSFVGTDSLLHDVYDFSDAYQHGTARTVKLTTYDSISNQADTATAGGTAVSVTAYSRQRPLVLLDGPLTVTTPTPVFNILWNTTRYNSGNAVDRPTWAWFAGTDAILSYQAQIIDSFGTVVHDTGVVAVSTPPTSTAITGAITANHSAYNTQYSQGGQIETPETLPAGQSAYIYAPNGTVDGAPAGGEYVTIGTTVQSSPPYVYSVAPVLAHQYGFVTTAHGVALVMGVIPITDAGATSLTVLPGLKNNTTYTLQVTAWANPQGQGAAWSAPASMIFHTAFNAPPPPTGFYVSPVPGLNPTSGGYGLLSWNTPTPTGSQSAPVSVNVYRKLSTDTIWTLIGTKPFGTGNQTLKCYNFGNEQETDFAIATVDVYGVESTLALSLNNIMTFRVGLWLTNPDNPAECLELGVFQNSLSSSMGGYPMAYEHRQDKDLTDLVGRAAPVVTTGVSYSLHTSTDPIFALETGYEFASLALLRKWDSQGTILYVRDVWGNNFLGAIMTLAEGAETLSIYQTVTLELQQTDPAQFVGVFG